MTVEMEVRVAELLNHYDVKTTYRLLYLGTSDNQTFFLETVDSNKYLLKHHLKAKASSVIEAEFLWLEALERDTDIIVQRPVRNMYNHLTTKLLDEESGQLTYWTVQS